MRYFIEVAGETLQVEVERASDGSYLVRTADGQQIPVRSLARHSDSVALLVSGRVLEVQTRESEVKFGGDRFSVRAESERDRAAAHSGARDESRSKRILAPMPGRIVRVSCVPGAAVQQGAPLIVIEAMKMQNELSAKADQVVRTVHVASGDTVDRGAVLVEFE